MLDYEVIGSGSTGNAVRIENIMIDCGMPYKDIEQAIKKCCALLITHIHTDHLNISTYNTIKKLHPQVVTYGNFEVAKKVDVDHVIDISPFTIPDGTEITPWWGSHSVNVNFFTWSQHDKDFIYATDTNVINIPEEMLFDELFVEANYDEVKVQYLRNKHKGQPGYDPTDGSMRHFSKQQCKLFYLLHRKSPDSNLYKMHKSERFYY